MTSGGRADPLWSRPSTCWSRPRLLRRKGLGNSRAWASGNHGRLWGPVCGSPAHMRPKVSTLLCLATSGRMLPFALKFKSANLNEAQDSVHRRALVGGFASTIRAAAERAPARLLLRGEPSCGRRLRHSRGCWPPQGHPRPVEAPVMRRWPGRAPHTLHVGRCAGPSGLGSRPFLPPRHAVPAEAAKSRPGSEAVPGGWQGQRGARPPVSAAQRPCGRVDGLRGGASRSHGGA